MDLLYENTHGYGPRVTENYLVRGYGSLGRIKANLKSWRFCTKDEQYNGCSNTWAYVRRPLICR